MQTTLTFQSFHFPCRMCGVEGRCKACKADWDRTGCAGPRLSGNVISFFLPKALTYHTRTPTQWWWRSQACKGAEGKGAEGKGAERVPLLYPQHPHASFRWWCLIAEGRGVKLSSLKFTICVGIHRSVQLFFEVYFIGSLYSFVVGLVVVALRLTVRLGVLE